jgi:hypothetical protein
MFVSPHDAKPMLPACPLSYVGPSPFRNNIVQLRTKSTTDIKKAIASPINTRYTFDCLLRRQTIGIVTTGVKNIENHNISPILSNKAVKF